MLKKYTTVLVLILFSILNIGGCDAEDFGVNLSSNNNDDFEVATNEQIRGTVIDVIPDRDSGVENITVRITNDDNIPFSATTNRSGIFTINANIDGSPEIEFIDPEDEDESLGSTMLNIFPGVVINLGDITLNDDGINFEENPEVTFVGELVDISCDRNSGTVDVEIEAEDGDVEVLVRITDSTDIEDDDGDNADCTDFFIDDKLRIEGNLLVGNRVEANSIIVQF